MAARKAGQIVVSFTAGTGAFQGDVEKASATVRNFGTSIKGMNSEMSRSVSGVQATSGALRVLEGGITNNLRAAERFTANVLGLGPALQAIFPVVGAIAFLGIITKLGEEVYKFYASMRDYPEKMAGGFTQLNSSLRLTNDELDLSNAHLQNEIAKLEGRQQNGVKVMLEEAKVAADKLEESLLRDMGALNKLLEEHKTTFMQQVFGQMSDKGLREELGGHSGFGGFYEQIADTSEAGRAKIEAASSLKDEKARVPAVDQAVDALKKELQKQYQDELDRIKSYIEKTRALTVDTRSTSKSAYENDAIRKQMDEAKTHLELLEESRRNITEQARAVPAQVEAYTLNKQKTTDETSRANAKIDRPFEDRMKAMAAQLDGIKEKMAAIGQGEAAETIAKAFADAQKQIEEVNKALERINPNLKLTKAVGPISSTAVPPVRTGADKKDEEGQIRYQQYLIATAEAEAAWKTKLDSTTDSIQDRIHSQQLLNDAIGKGYAATKAASVETSVMGAAGAGKYTDEDWMKSHQSDVSSLRQKFGQEYDAQHAEQTASATESLTKQIELEKTLAAAQIFGAEAVRVATLASNLRKIALDGERYASGQLTEKVKQQIAAAVDLFNAQRSNSAATEIASLMERTDGIKRLTAAVLEGAEAERKAALENKYSEIRRAGQVSADEAVKLLGDTATPEQVASVRKSSGENTEKVVAATQAADEGEHQQKIQAEALKTGLAYKNQLETIDQQIAALRSLPPIEQQTATVVLSLKNLENERLKTLLDQIAAFKNLHDENLKLQAEISLKMGGPQDGVRAFFLEMQEQAKQTSAIIEEALNGALDKVSDNLAKLMTGQKTAWAKMFQSLGEETLKSAIKSELQVGLGKLGGAFGVGGKADGSTAANALWVRMADATGMAVKGVSDLAKSPAAAPETGTSEKLPGPGGLPGLLQKLLGGNKTKGNVLFGNGGLLGTGGVPTAGSTPGAEGKPDGSESNPVGVTLAPNGSGPDGTEGNPFYVVTSGAGGVGSKAVSFGGNELPPSTAGQTLESIGSDITTISGAAAQISEAGGSVQGKSGKVLSKLATGGPVKSGAGYIVGENGPEFFTSLKDGHIVDHETTKRLARAGMLPAGVKVPGVSTPSPGSHATAAPKRLTPRADGGDVSAGDSYMVGERGPELFTSGGFSSDQASRRTPNGGGVAYYSIDARGTDPVQTEQRVKAALVAVHGSAVTTSIQGVDERAKRQPQRS